MIGYFSWIFNAGQSTNVDNPFSAPKSELVRLVSVIHRVNAFNYAFLTFLHLLYTHTILILIVNIKYF